MESRNLEVRNHGLRSREMSSALTNALKELGQSYKSIATNKSHLKDFAQFAKSEHGIKDLRNLEREHVLKYAEDLRARWEKGEISASTAQNKLSAVNTALTQARLDRALHVDGVREAKLPGRTGITTSDKSLPQESHLAIQKEVSERLAVQMSLQRELGLRFKESCLINARMAISEAQKTGIVTISNGTKGGRERTIPIVRPEQIAALKAGESIQNRERSLIPENIRFAEYQRAAYEEITAHGIGFHSERHAYANERFAELTGLKSPIKSGLKKSEWYQYAEKKLELEPEATKEVINNARMQVSNELGHGRVNVTSAYLGKF